MIVASPAPRRTFADRSCFRAMGTRVEILVEAGTATTAAVQAREWIRDWEAVFSRFDERSELSRLNEAGSAVCSQDLFEVVELALRARLDTHGRFDPTVHDALVQAGYDRSFGELRYSAPSAHPRDAEARPRCEGRVEIDHSSGRVSLGAGVRLDLGGIAKGWIADRVCQRLQGCGGVLVNAGGDIACSAREDARSWPIGVPAPGRQLTVEIDQGAVATSGVDRRVWLAAGEACNHVIHPRTARPLRSWSLRVTAIDVTCAEAEVHATRLLLSPTRSLALAEARSLGLHALLVGSDATTDGTGAFA